MDDSLKKIAAFIEKHHVMSLASSFEEELSVCSLFYAYLEAEKLFVVASSEDTTHIKHILNNPKIAGNVLLETQKIGEIKGLQFRGLFKKLQKNSLKVHYFKKFPYALAMNPTLWQIEVESFKLTDNTLGFGRKIIWP